MEKFDYHSWRARRARVARILDKPFWRVLAACVAILMILGGIWLLCLKNALGWLLAGFSGIFVMLFFWIKYDLAVIEVGKGGTINDYLSRRCLGLLSRDPKPQEVARMLLKTKSGRFMMVRFGISPDFMEIMATGAGDMDKVFFNALRIREKTNSAQIGGAVLLVALIESFPEFETVLAKMKLAPIDLYRGVDWFNHLHGLVDGEKKPRRTGGIARDLTFGYTPLLSQFGVNISEQRARASKTQIYQKVRQEALAKMIQIFSHQGRQNVALIGAYGSGRTTTVNAFAEILLDAESKIPRDLKFRQIFVLDASAIISAAAGRSVEGLVVRILNEAFAAKNIIICLDNAHLFFENGVGSIDISNVLLPILEAGRLRMILTMDQQRYLEISARNSALANALNKIMIEPADEMETLRILEDLVPTLEYRHNVVYMYRTLGEAYRLSERYIHDIEMPGRAKLLLESAANFAENGIVLPESAQRAVERTQGVKIQLAETTDDREKLLNLEDLLHQRMVDQVEAVKVVSDALRRAAVGVRNEKRPIGTFLFLGPTGVGKTELAKALSEVYFDGEKQVVRLDLNEFVRAEDVQRLIADGAEDEMSLTAQVMKKPFSVVLLDEIEKAHPQVLTTLLQVLDEGILRDARNREVSFRDAIIIATSNAGADKIRAEIAAGRNLEDFQEQFVNDLIDSGQFKPEFLNRFDEICLFKPLSREDLVAILDLTIASVNKTLAPQKIEVVVADDAKEILVERGYDPRLGARPMRRVVQRTVENIVAKSVLSGVTGAGAKVVVTKDDLNVL